MVVNIAGNRYWLVVWINYPCRVVYLRFFGTPEGERLDLPRGDTG